ncbi:hypothetical protein IE991_03065 [Klebsiella pneumoniae]|uniref:Uncharacterized protein n=1 Tax=Klebsiella pneumoniae TaxID=573 RepID=A0A927D8K6_KLEPN|nr:hypothetical protein [Klebsiella pneumoniae]
MPGGWDNDTFVPYDYGYFAFVYDKNKLANPPKSLKELVEGPQNGGSSMKIRVPAPRDWACCCGCKRSMAIKRPRPRQKLAAKTVTVTKGWSEAYGLFLKGESDWC